MRKKMTPGRFIMLGFLSVIAIGTLLLSLPIALKDYNDYSFIDTLFTSASAVCVTGLAPFDIADTYTVFGQVIMALLIQTGGLGITSIGVGLIMLTGKKVQLRQRSLAKEALNYNSFHGIMPLIRAVLATTLTFEGIGALLSFTVFIQRYPFWKAVGVSIFHSVSSFNNAGFDIFGGGKSMTGFSDNIPLNLITCFLIITGGVGFVVIKEISETKKIKKLSLHSKTVISMTVTLLVIGTVLIKLTSNVSWLQSFFMSTSARTAGFTTVSLAAISNAALFVIIVLMVIGASPGSTGGGIKTTTFFVLLIALFSTSAERSPSAFKRKIKSDVIFKAFVIVTLALLIIITSVFLLCISEKDMNFSALFFEAVSAFSTAGLSTGITTDVSVFGKAVLICTMFIGRVGPLTMASLWIFKKPSGIEYAEESITVG